MLCKAGAGANRQASLRLWRALWGFSGKKRQEFFENKK